MKRDVIEANKLIAKFMGGKLVDVYLGKIKQTPQFYDSDDINNPLCGRKHSADGDTLEYHKNWEWLMGVVRKIWNISEETDGKYAQESDYYKEFYELTFHRLYIWTDKETVWNAAIEYIEWFYKWEHKAPTPSETLGEVKQPDDPILDLLKKHATSYCISAIQNIYGHRVEEYRWRALIKDIKELKSQPVPVEKLLSGKADDVRFDSVVFFIEADSYAQQSIWSEFHEETKWKQDNRGYFQELGQIDNDKNKPVCVSFSFAEIFGKRICFYNCCSRYMDATLIEKWIKKHYPVKWNNNQYAMTDATNFHLAMHACQ